MTRLTRRDLGLASASVALAACRKDDKPPMTAKLPTLYVPHGGGPWPFVHVVDEPAMGGLRGYLEGIPASLPETPRAILVVSAHWEEAIPTVQTAAKPSLLFDYYNFPKASYELTWPAPGSPAVAEEVRSALSAAGIESGVDAERGYDHGTFVVTKLMYPTPTIPTLQLSLTKDLDPKTCLAVGRALAPLRAKGIFILGSGFSYHNLKMLRKLMANDPEPLADSKAFDDWLAETVSLDAAARDQRLAEWDKAPRARACHPREEHLLPLMVCAGAGAEDAGTLPFRNVVMGSHTLAAQFG